jgi:hypothetical protein
VWCERTGAGSHRSILLDFLCIVFSILKKKNEKPTYFFVLVATRVRYAFHYVCGKVKKVAKEPEKKTMIPSD